MRPTLLPSDFFSLREDPYEAARFLVRFAALAPSSHNTQPWRFSVRENVIEVRGDRKRALAASDLDHRQLFISVGCALENLLQAAAWYGLPTNVGYFPDMADPFFAARVRLDRIVPLGEALDSGHLAAFITARHNNRSAYETHAVAPDFLAAIKAIETADIHIAFLERADDREAATRIAGDATEEAFHNNGFTTELSQWIKPSLMSYDDGMPGYNIGIPWPVSFIVPFAIRYGNVAAKQRADIERMLRATPMFGVIHTTSDDPRAWVAAGQTLERIWLMAERSGVRLGVLAAPVEIGDHHRHLAELINTNERPQVFFRLGYSARVPKQSPRRTVEAVIGH